MNCSDIAIKFHLLGNFVLMGTLLGPLVLKLCFYDVNSRTWNLSFCYVESILVVPVPKKLPQRSSNSGLKLYRGFRDIVHRVLEHTESVSASSSDSQLNNL